MADVLEGEWNQRLRDLDEVRRDRDRRQAEDRGKLAEDQRRRVLELACDFPRLWNDPATPDRERKRMVQLVIEDVTITRGEMAGLGIRLRGGAARQLAITPDLPSFGLHATPRAVVEAVDALLEDHCEGEIAEILNQRGLRTGHGKSFTPRRVQRVRRNHGLKPRRQRLRERGLLTRGELAERLGVAPGTVKTWRLSGLLAGTPWNDRNGRLFEIPDNPPVKNRHKFKRRAEPGPAAPPTRGLPQTPGKALP